MRTLQECIATEKGGKLIYAINALVPFEEKQALLEKFVKLYAERQSWSVTMHMTKRSMPFATHGSISFRGAKLGISKMIIHFDLTTIGNNIKEQAMVWEAMMKKSPSI